MTEAEARKHLLNFRTPTHIADEARAVLAPIEAAELARKTLAAEQEVEAQEVQSEDDGAEPDFNN